MPLRTPVDIEPATTVGAVHFIAIGGAGMSGIAQLFADLGVPTSGCDQSDSPTLRAMAASGITTYVGHDPAQLEGIETVVVSSAIRESNPELIEARRRGLRIWHRSAALASLMLGHRGVSVTGTHGKTTTTGMTATMLEAAGADPSYVIGSPLATSGRSAHLGRGEVFVVEADESDGSFLQYPSEIVVITNVEADHLDNWETPMAYMDGFEAVATRPGVRAVVLDVDDPGAREIAERLAGRVRVIRYGEAPDADVRLTALDFSGTTARARLGYGEDSGDLVLKVPGRHNLSNAAAAYAVGRLLGLRHDLLLAGAGGFTGTLRRFQLVGDAGGVRIYDDYAHHPTEITATLTAARRAVGEGRLVACFQPHLYTRTRDFAREFGEALALADLVVLTDVYAAREDPIPGVSGRLIVDSAAAAGASVIYVPDKRELPQRLAELVRPGDLVMTIGAGDVTLVGPLLASLLADSSAGAANG